MVHCHDDVNLAVDIRTYAVTPLNEECGLLEWVSNTNALKSILEKGYSRLGKKIYVRDLSMNNVDLTDNRGTQLIGRESKTRSCGPNKSVQR